MSYNVIIQDYICFKEKITYNLVPSDSLRFRKWSKDFSFHSLDIITSRQAIGQHHFKFQMHIYNIETHASNLLMTAVYSQFRGGGCNNYTK